MDCAVASRKKLRQAQQQLAPWLILLLTQPYLRLDRHSWMQPMFAVLAGSEFDSHRQALHHFHVVPGRVLGGQKTEAVAAGAGQISDIASVVAAESVDMDSDLLAAMHARELGLLEVGCHPDLIGLGHEHQGLPGLDSRPQFNAALTN